MKIVRVSILSFVLIVILIKGPEKLRARKETSSFHLPPSVLEAIYGKKGFTKRRGYNHSNTLITDHRAVEWNHPSVSVVEFERVFRTLNHEVIWVALMPCSNFKTLQEYQPDCTMRRQTKPTLPTAHWSQMKMSLLPMYTVLCKLIFKSPVMQGYQVL